MGLVRYEIGFAPVAAAGSLCALLLSAPGFPLRVTVLVPFRLLRGRLIDPLVDLLDLFPGLFLVGLALQFGELSLKLGDLLIFLFKPDARILALFEDHGNEFGLGQFLQPRLIRLGWVCLAFQGGGCHLVNASLPLRSP